MLGHIRSLFNWAINRGSYGLESSPCDRLRPAILIGAKEPRQRVLADEELVVLWRAFDQLGYPFGPLHRILLLTGMREREVADARWREIDLKKKLWTVPPERFKSNATHLIPLTDQLVEISKRCRASLGAITYSALVWERSPSVAFQSPRNSSTAS